MATAYVLPPKDQYGEYDKALVKEMFIASAYLDWTRFAEDQNWDSHRTRSMFPVKSWQDEKRRLLAEKQTDVISGLVFERRFKWTQDILATLDRYPRLIDMGSQLAEAKMSEYAEKYKDYVEWKKAGKDQVKLKNGKWKTLTHPWEKIDGAQINYMLKGLKDITEAKLKALMLDKWAVRLDISKEELDPEPEGADGTNEGLLTVEGKGEFKIEDMQRWFDEFIDKPTLGPAVPQEEKNVTPGNYMEKERDKPPPPVVSSEKPSAAREEYQGVQILDDNGRPVNNGEGNGGS